MSVAMVPEAVVTVVGPFEGATVERWGNLIAEAMALRPKRLVVDLADCPSVDAAAIVVLLGAHRAMIHSGGQFALRDAGPRVRRVLRIARVDRVFELTTANSAWTVQGERGLVGSLTQEFSATNR